jgi:hypothetical protein
MTDRPASAWSRRCTIGAPFIAAGSCITATAAARASKYTERLAEAGIEPSVGSVDDSHDNTLSETINGLQGRGDPSPCACCQI